MDFNVDRMKSSFDLPKQSFPCFNYTSSPHRARKTLRKKILKRHFHEAAHIPKRKGRRRSTLRGQSWFGIEARAHWSSGFGSLRKIVSTHDGKCQVLYLLKSDARHARTIESESCYTRCPFLLSFDFIQFYNFFLFRFTWSYETSARLLRVEALKSKIKKRERDGKNI